MNIKKTTITNIKLFGNILNVLQRHFHAFYSIFYRLNQLVIKYFVLELNFMNLNVIEYERKKLCSITY